jgi:VIT1/CCC1 family predicted Fe2+/Mn2+ transporter
MRKYGENTALVNDIVGLIVGIILIVAVAIPITTSVITTANLTGIAATVVGFLPTFLALGGLVLVAGTLVSRA